MSSVPAGVSTHVEGLLVDPGYAGHPLRGGLETLWQEHQRLVRRLEQITALTDGFGDLGLEREADPTRRLERQLRHLEKVARVSDRYQAMLRELNVALAHASTHDLLTGLANRRMLGERLRAETERSMRSQSPLAVALVDIDHFKDLNERYGSDVGDRVLQALADAMRDKVREYDLCGRWGGEEFLLLLPSTDGEHAHGVLERVHTAVRAMPFADLQPAPQVTVSIGVATMQIGETVDSLVNRADDALLSAKREGRDRIVYAD
ncbi:MAG TPA: biofilm regulation diguanylate cyclase SiaD [Arenimonas sp.]|nr:biofilm regulation diguanylate cyclase SiaD [Arenimonas sp.]